jgi:hypothetical protein
MADRVSFSGKNLTLADIAGYYADVEAAIRGYYADTSATFAVRFAHYTRTEVHAEMDQRLMEHDHASALIALAAVEAAFRIDYLLRVDTKQKDRLSRALRDLHKEKGARVSLEEDIFDAWRQHASIPPRLIGDLRGAFRYRHWLAHGMYWTAKLGQRYDFRSIWLLADGVLNTLPILRD